MEPHTIRGQSIPVRNSQHHTFGPIRPKISSRRSSTQIFAQGNTQFRQKIVTIHGLLYALRMALHNMFATKDPMLSFKSLYDNCCHQAFRFFTTTNSIYPDAMTHRIAKLGIKVHKSLCSALFKRIDQEDFGEINYPVFSQRIFLPNSYFMEESGRLKCISSILPESIRDLETSQDTTGIPVSTMTKGSNAQKDEYGDAIRRYSQVTGKKFAAMSFDELEIELGSLLILKVSHDKTDQIKQMYQLFTKSQNGITIADFHRTLESLQLFLPPALTRGLFNRLDDNRSEKIEFPEFESKMSKFITTTVGASTPSHQKHSLAPLPPHCSNLPGSPHCRPLITIFNNKQPRKFDLPNCAMSSTQNSDGSVSYIASHDNPVIDTLELQSKTRSLSQIIYALTAELRVALESHISWESDRYRQAFKLFSKASHISFLEFKNVLKSLDLSFSDDQLKDMFNVFDFDKSGDLDLKKFVEGSMLGVDSLGYWSTPKARKKIEELRNNRSNIAFNSIQSAWTTDDIVQKLRAKIEQRTSRSSDCFRQAFKVFHKVNGILPNEFHNALVGMGLQISRKQSDALFEQFDKDKSGGIDLDEFIHRVLPPDYIGIQWVTAADELHRSAAIEKLKNNSNNTQLYATEKSMENWSLDEIESRLRDKIEQATTKSSDTFRQAYKIFRKSTGITLQDFQERLLSLGFRLTPSQAQALFSRYDVDNSNDIDLQEFCTKLLMPDYSGDGDYWGHSRKFRKAKEAELLEYVQRSKNGLLVLPAFDVADKYHRRRYSSSLGDQLNKENIAGKIDSLVDTSRQMGTDFDTKITNQVGINSNSGTAPRVATPRPSQPSPRATPSPRVSRVNTSRKTENRGEANIDISASMNYICNKEGGGESCVTVSINSPVAPVQNEQDSVGVNSSSNWWRGRRETLSKANSVTSGGSRISIRTAKHTPQKNRQAQSILKKMLKVKMKSSNIEKQKMKGVIPDN